MATFDFSKAASIITTSPSPILDVMSTQFGVPQCMLDFTKEILAAFPSPVLNSINAGIDDGKALADSIFKDIMRRVFLDTGIVEYDTTLGRFVFVSSSSNMGVEQDMLSNLNNMYGLGTILGFGAEAWVIGQNVSAQINQIKQCVDQMKSFLALQKGASAVADKLAGFTGVDANGNPVSFPAPPPVLEAASKVYDDNKQVLEQAGGFIAQADSQLQNIKDIKQARLADPENNPEPVFWNNMVNDDPNSPWFGQTLGNALSGLTTFDLMDAEASPTGQAIVPTVAPVKSILYGPSSMGPPLSTKGQFLFSRTGIYYDSYGGGLNYSGCITNIVSAIYYDPEGNPIPGAGVPGQFVKWMHEYNPNLGGRGEAVSWNTFNGWANTAFDLDQIDESPMMQPFYDDDHFLQVLIDQKNREVYDLSTYITDLQLSGYTEDSALLSNQRQILYADIATHNSKINKRKKQIQVHVLLSPHNHPAVAGKIPINSFGGLDAGKLLIEKAKQEKLIFHPGDTSGLILPLCPTFIKSEIAQDKFKIEELMIPPVGVGGIISSDPNVSGVSGTMLSLNDQIITKDLVAIYNFLDADLVAPDSDNYFVINCATSSSSEEPAQLVASSVESMFPSGIGLPYFRGICNFFSGVSGDGNPKSSSYTGNLQFLHSAYRPYGYGRIQSGWNNIESLLYNERGASFEFWTHVPDLGDSTGPGWNSDSSLSALHRVVLGCENRGGSASSVDGYWNIGPSQGSNSIRGLLLGFSRDRRITEGLPPSNISSENDINNRLVFHMSPTQSINTSGVTFVNASSTPAICVQDITPPSGYYGIKVDTSTLTSDGSSLNDCSSNFMLVTVTIDYALNAVNIYLNGKSLASSSVDSTFAVTGPPQIPSMTDSSSFSYNTRYSELPTNAPLFPPNSLGQRDFWYWDGPEPQGNGKMSLTPWIIGGGYTDGMYYSKTGELGIEGMNFMGGEWGGKKSGLYGYIGSLKLYNRAISASDVLVNYKAQRGFFENIKL